MTDNPFVDKANRPGEKELATALGRSITHWHALRAHLAETYPPVTEEWKFFSPKFGWQLKVMRKKRTIFWMNPGSKQFLAVTTFGEKAVAAARESDLPAEFIAEIEGARKYAEGRPVSLEIRSKADYVLATKVAAIKMAN